MIIALSVTGPVPMAMPMAMPVTAVVIVPAPTPSSTRVSTARAVTIASASGVGPFRHGSRQRKAGAHVLGRHRFNRLAALDAAEAYVDGSKS
jgi:hypothetical protein